MFVCKACSLSNSQERLVLFVKSNILKFNVPFSLSSQENECLYKIFPKLLVMYFIHLILFQPTVSPSVFIFLCTNKYFANYVADILRMYNYYSFKVLRWFFWMNHRIKLLLRCLVTKQTYMMINSAAINGTPYQYNTTRLVMSSPSQGSWIPSTCLQSKHKISIHPQRAINQQTVFTHTTLGQHNVDRTNTIQNLAIVPAQFKVLKGGVSSIRNGFSTVI